MGRVILVSNRLPVVATIEDGEIRLTRSTGGLATGLRDFREACDATWIGWPGELPALTSEQTATLSERLTEHNARAVTLSPDEIDGFYGSISNGVIWPLFHYLLDQIPPRVQGWETFRAVNEKFAQAAADEYREGDVIWVHDYQLMLLPSLLRRRLPHAKIGFFLHIPFPSSEVFSICPWRSELLEGVLGADLIGFHTPAYLRHFTTSLRRVLGVETSVGQIRRNGREINVGVFPMGVDAASWAARAEEAHVVARAAEIRREAGARKLVVGIDRLDYTKGIRHRLLAVEELLRSDPSLAERLRFIQVTVPSRQSVQAYAAFRDDVDALVGRINSTYATSSSVPIHHLHHALSQDEVAALYRAADVMLVTPLRDGMNLIAKEFVAARTDDGGVLVLSEFAGAAHELGDALRVNPYDVDAVASTIRTALDMPPIERAKRMHALRAQVVEQDVQRWARSFIETLEDIPDSSNATDAEAFADLPALIARLEGAGPVELILDYDGTLVPFADTPDDAVPDTRLIDLLRRLGSRDDTQVHIVTGRSRASIGGWLGTLPVAISAEHGLWSRRRPADAWEILRPVSVAWKARLRPLLEHFVHATPGSFIEEKTAALVWHYRLAESEFAEHQARELRLFLGELLSNVPVEVITGPKAVEIKAQGVSKRDAVEALVGSAPGALVIAIGDDHTDEMCYPVLPEGSVTVHVNGGTTNAEYRVKDPRDVQFILSAIADRPGALPPRWMTVSEPEPGGAADDELCSACAGAK